jgi:hypothetical protein
VGGGCSVRGAGTFDRSDDLSVVGARRLRQVLTEYHEEVRARDPPPAGVFVQSEAMRHGGTRA